MSRSLDLGRPTEEELKQGQLGMAPELAAWWGEQGAAGAMGGDPLQGWLRREQQARAVYKRCAIRASLPAVVRFIPNYCPSFVKPSFMLEIERTSSHHCRHESGVLHIYSHCWIRGDNLQPCEAVIQYGLLTSTFAFHQCAVYLQLLFTTTTFADCYGSLG